ncbi:MAG TPA: ATP synthase F1 subunit gamma [Vicinamibacteria bacterium]|nr:ATP synthase F1 subunit gamma [Vicinamibacteria bacterium]
MASVREIRRRIRSVGATAQITRAMQMVASSKMRKAQQAAINGQPFARLLYRIQREVTRNTEVEHPLLVRREVRTRGIVLVAADKGLCGALNGNVFRVAAQYDPASTVFVTAGKRAAQFVARTGRRLLAEFEYTDTPTFAQARAIASFARDLFLKREVDEVDIVATRFVNTLTQVAVSMEFLPIGEITRLKIPGLEKVEQEIDDSECVFEPSAAGVLDFLLGHYLNFIVYQVLLNAKASEQSARMVAMKNATDNAERLIQDLSLEGNKLRQGNITQELLEIAGGQAE